MEGELEEVKGKMADLKKVCSQETCVQSERPVGYCLLSYKPGKPNVCFPQALYGKFGNSINLD